MSVSDIEIDYVNVDAVGVFGTMEKSQIARMLDRIIVLLMIAILVLLSWPVCQTVWQQSHPHIMKRPMLQAPSTPEATPVRAADTNVV